MQINLNMIVHYGLWKEYFNQGKQEKKYGSDLLFCQCCYSRYMTFEHIHIQLKNYNIPIVFLVLV